MNKVYTFEVVETFLGGPVNLLSGITDLEIVQSGGVTRLYTATRAGGGVTALTVGAQMTLIDQEVTASTMVLPAPARLEMAVLNGAASMIVMGGSMARMGGWRLGADGGFTTAVSINASPGGVVAAQTMAMVGGNALHYVSMYGQSSIQCLRLAANGEMVPVATLVLGPNQQGIDITSMTTLDLGGVTYLCATSRVKDAITLFRVGPTGALQQTGTIGASGGLGINDPSDVHSVVMAGVTYLIVAAAATSSLSVVAVQADGALRVTDHVADTLDTRFQGAQTLATVTVGDDCRRARSGTDVARAVGHRTSRAAARREHRGRCVGLPPTYRTSSMRMPSSSQVGSIGRRLIARPAARRAVHTRAHACIRCTCAAPGGGTRTITSSTPGSLSRSSCIRWITPSGWYGDVVSGMSPLRLVKLRSGWAAKNIR